MRIGDEPVARFGACSLCGSWESVREVLMAMELHLDTLWELGRPIPEPGSRRGVGVSDIVLDLDQAVELTEEAGGVSAQIVDEIGEGVGQELDAPEGGMTLSRRFFDNWVGTVEEGQPNATESRVLALVASSPSRTWCKHHTDSALFTQLPRVHILRPWMNVGVLRPPDAAIPKL